MNYMKILTLVYDLNRGGVQKTAINFAVGFHALGHESHLLAQDVNGVLVEDAHKGKVSVFDENDFFKMKNCNYDLVFLHSLHLCPILVKRVLDVIRSVNSDVRVIEKNVFSKPTPWEIQLDYSVQMSRWCELNYVCNGGKAPTIVVSHPIDTDAFGVAKIEEKVAFRAKYSIPENSTVILRVGQAYPRKWSVGMLKLYAEAFEANKQLCLIMVNPSHNMTDFLCQLPTRVKASVVVIERIESLIEMQACYACADLFLHVSRWGESFGNVFLEAALSGVPIIAFSTPWVDNYQIEVVELEGRGVVCHTENQLKHCLLEYLGNIEQIKSKHESRVVLELARNSCPVVAANLLEFVFADDPSTNPDTNIGPISLLRKTKAKPPLGLLGLVFLRFKLANQLCTRILTKIEQRFYGYW